MSQRYGLKNNCITSSSTIPASLFSTHNDDVTDAKRAPLYYF